MRRLLLVVSLLFGLLAMHGGLGTIGCSSSPHDQMAMVSLPATATSDMSLHHTPAQPVQAPDPLVMPSCLAPLPPSGLHVPLPVLLAVLTLTIAVSLLPLGRRSGRPTGREPPRPRWLDPINGWGVLRT